MEIEIDPRIDRFLRKNLSKKRYEHTLRVTRLAVDLAGSHGVDERGSVSAALFHDVAREMSPGKLRRLVKGRVTVEPWEDQNPVLLHGKAAAVIMREVFGITDERVLEAVMYHTTGKPGMNDISKVLFIADAAEPGREHITQKFARRIYKLPLNLAMLELVEGQLAYLKQKKGFIAGVTEELYDSLKKEVGNIETQKETG